MQNFELRIGLARCGHCTPCHRAALFIFHSSPFTSRRGHFSLFTLHFSLISRSAVHRASQRAPLGIAMRCTGRCSALRFSVHFHARPGARRQALFSRRPKTKMLRDGIHRTALFALHFCPVCPACLSLCEAEGFSVPIYSRPRRLSRGYPFRFPENCLGRLHPCFCPTLWSKAFSRDETWADGMSPARP